MTKLYHSTTSSGAARIERDGFRESSPAGLVRGVFLADRVLTHADGVASGADAAFEVIVPHGFDLSDFELIEEGRPPEAYREWIVPARHVNAWPRARVTMDLKRA